MSAISLAVQVECPRNIPGVYILYSGETIVYVGQSQSIYIRVGAHLKDKEFDSMKIIECEDTNERSRIEASLIAEFLPKYNKDLPVNPSHYTEAYVRRNFVFTKREIKKFTKVGRIKILVFNKKNVFHAREIDSLFSDGLIVRKVGGMS